MTKNDSVRTALALAVRADLPVLLWGAPGTGKTSAVVALGRQLDLPVEVVVGSVREPGDFAGLPVVRQEGTWFAPPRWAERLASAGSGLLFLDELTTAPLGGAGGDAAGGAGTCRGRPRTSRRGADRGRREPAGPGRGRLGAVGAAREPARPPGLGGLARGRGRRPGPRVPRAGRRPGRPSVAGGGGRREGAGRRLPAGQARAGARRARYAGARGQELAEPAQLGDGRDRAGRRRGQRGHRSGGGGAGDRGGGRGGRVRAAVLAAHAGPARPGDPAGRPRCAAAGSGGPAARAAGRAGRARGGRRRRSNLGTRLDGDRPGLQDDARRGRGLGSDAGREPARAGAGLPSALLDLAPILRSAGLMP
ncbi:AAA family ATPase [Nonomuraea ferruginea]